MLKKDLRFLDSESGELIRSEIVNEALKMDKKLIETLLSQKDIREKFFMEIKGYWVFEINKFIEFIQDKNFLSDSYTKFKNKIGLNIDGKFLNERNEISLVWPFKDCILEGGMTKEDQKRNEIFFNAILAQDEIDRLLDPKVLTNFKRVTVKGEEKVTDFKRDKDGTIRENLIIKGNNLLALHSLKKEFQGKIKLIYIDPPYNTGKDSFGYNDRFNHSSWLTFMKNRLEVGKLLLNEEGFIFVSCDDNEQSYLKILMDEIFGRENFVSCISVVVKPEGRNYGSIAQTHEFLLVYSRNKNELNELVITDKKFDYNDEKGGFNLKDLKNGNTAFNINNRPNLYYPIYVNVKSKNKDGLYSVTTNKKVGFVEVYPKESKGVKCVWRWNKEKVDRENNLVVAKKISDGSLSIFQKTRRNTTRAKSFWNEKEFYTLRGNQHLEKLFKKKIFSNPKPEHLIQRILLLGTEEKDIILDYHVGSGTTCAVAHKMKRQYVGIEQIEYVDCVTKERLRKVIQNKDEGGISKEIAWAGGGEFIYCALMKFNEEAIEKIQSAKTTETSLKIWEELVNHYFLNYDVDIKRFNDNQEEFNKLALEKQKKILAGMLNKNQLYVNLSEIDDIKFKVSKEDRELNKKFYK